MGNAIDITGVRSGSLVALYPKDNKRKRVSNLWVCQCDCGNLKIVRGDHILRNDTISCGCQHYAKKYGNYNKRLYRIWTTMKQRCHNPNANHYPNYGGRGINVCDEWRNDYAAFHEWAMHNGYTDELSIDRIDNNIGYTPKNCRWVTRIEQSNNRRNTMFVMYDGINMPVAEAARRIGINPTTLAARLLRGWTLERAFSSRMYRTGKSRETMECRVDSNKIEKGDANENNG